MNKLPYTNECLNSTVSESLLISCDYDNYYKTFTLEGFGKLELSETCKPLGMHDLLIQTKIR